MVGCFLRGGGKVFLFSSLFSMIQLWLGIPSSEELRVRKVREWWSIIVLFFLGLPTAFLFLCGSRIILCYYFLF